MANRQVRNPGQIAQFNETAQISGNVPSFAVDTGQAARAIADVAGSLSNRLGQLADKAAAREGQMAGLAAGAQSGAAYLQAQAIDASAAGAAGKGPWLEQAKALLRKEEGFRETPYWDVNAQRIGYGSDTTVTADGKVVRVTKGMRITREDAERDLDHRLLNVEGARARKQLGAAWDGLSESAKAALSSVAYNYGSLPSVVVKAARTGDREAIATAVQGLAANRGRRKNEAAMIRGGMSIDPIVTAGTGKKPDPVVLPASEPLSREPLALRRDGTIRGDAFDDAASSSYAWRMQEGLSRDLFAAQAEFEDDPGGFTAATAKIRDTYLQDLSFADPQLREGFEKYFVQRSEAYRENIVARHEKKLRDEQEASFAAGYSSQLVDLERQAQVLGANPKGDKLIGDQVSSFQASIDGAVASGTISPAQAAKYKMDVAETAARGRIQGVYDALPTPERKRQFSLSLLEDWKDGDGPLATLPYDTVKGISDTLRRDAQSQVEATRAANKVEAARVAGLVQDDVASVAASGKGLVGAENGLDAKQVLDALGPDKLEDWQRKRATAGRLYDATSNMETQSADDLSTRLELLTPRAGTPGYAEQQDIFEAASKKASAVLKARATDPAGAVQQSFPKVKELADAAEPRDPASMQTLVSARLQAQEALDIPELARDPLTLVEAQNLARSITMQSDPKLRADAIVQLVDQVGSVYGAHAEQVLGQVLSVQGIDKEMARNAAAQFRRLSKGGAVTSADRRQTKVLDETAASERSAQPEMIGAIAAGASAARAASAGNSRRAEPVTGPVGRSANPMEVVASPARQSTNMRFPAPPTLASIQHLKDNPQLAPQFDALFGEGAARLYLPPAGAGQ